MTPFSIFNSRLPAVDNEGRLSTTFFRFLLNLFQSAGGGGPTTSITVGTSAFTYTAAQVGIVFVQGGTVSKIEFSRDGGTTLIDTGATSGPFYLKNQDQVKVTYSSKPTMTFVPA